MNEFQIRKIENDDIESIKRLFEDAGWKSYASKINQVIKGFEKSLLILGAFIEDELIGFIRVVGDGETIIYIQDLVVLKNFKRKGIARNLVDTALQDFKNVRQKVLITDNNPEATGFYKSIGFADASDKGIVAFVKFED